MERYFNGLVQEWSNFIANALDLHLFCTKPSIYNVELLEGDYVWGTEYVRPCLSDWYGSLSTDVGQ